MCHDERVVNSSVIELVDAGLSNLPGENNAQGCAHYLRARCWNADSAEGDEKEAAIVP